MSKPRCSWWSYVKNMVRRYPDKDNDDERAAVAAAIAQTERMSNGSDQLKLVKMVLIAQTHTLSGAALQVPCCYETAKRWQQQFIKRVAENFRCDGLKE